jgi:DnaK suppressor protein
MPREERANPVAVAPVAPGRSCLPRWRALLEARWQARLREVTELSLAYHAAAAASRELLCRAVVARRKLADVEEALGRLAAGTFGYCEQCESPIPGGLLAAVPERRYCPRCEAGAGPAPALSGRSRA